MIKIKNYLLSYLILFCLFGWSFQMSGALPPRPMPTELESIYRFDLITPTGSNIFRNSLVWESIQIDYPSYPQPGKCALNASKVLKMSGYSKYSAESVGKLLSSIVNSGGTFIKFPTDKKGIISKINTIYNGNIPVGTVIGGCLYDDCFKGVTGQRHSAIVGEVDKNGNIFVYHNNWYRPENEDGVWKQNMVSKLFLEKGFIRQWMPTPWIKLIRDSNGVVINIKSLLPQIDDLDPRQYFISLAIPKEITSDISLGLGRTSTDSTLYFNDLIDSTVSELFLFSNFRPQSDIFDVELDDDGSILKK